MPKVSFILSGTEVEHPLRKEVEIKKGETLFKAARVNSIPLGSSCRGDCICGWCKVEILEGTQNLSEPGDCERRLMLSGDYQENERVACRTRVFGDVSITTGYW
ncbi:MAG: (2Fe-2S)-binding protein [Bacteroidetes bacterium]|nr:(2Fe-2S)-binding protein [Bacteroidota bacterium]